MIEGTAVTARAPGALEVVGVGEDDVRGLAAEIEGDALDRARRGESTSCPTSVEAG